MLNLKNNGLDKHAKGMSLHSGYFDTASNLLNPVEIGQGLFLFEDEGRGVGECAHTVVANNSKPVQ